MASYFVSKLTLAIAGLWLCATACSSQFNTVRLQRKPKQNLSVYTVSTEHYLHIDENHVIELDRGERSLTIEFTREVAATSVVSETIRVTAKLYHDDAPFPGKLHIRLNNEDFHFIAEGVTRENFSETVTVLDTGQRREDNPGLSNSAQAQTGYITFGKPVSAGSSKRLWKIYRFTLPVEPQFASALRRVEQLEISSSLKGHLAICDVSNRQIAAWKRYAGGIADAEIEP
ncbi:MAG: hypothetical protein U1F27_10010 [Turneriella sp.]